MPAPLITEYDQQIRELYEMGWSTTQVADRLPVSRTVVVKALARQGVRARKPVPPHRNRLSHAEIDRTIALYRSGLTLDEVAEVFGVSRHAIFKRLERAGEPRRSRGYGSYRRAMRAREQAAPAAVLHQAAGA